MWGIVDSIIVCVVVCGLALFILWLARDLKKMEIQSRGLALYDTLQKHPNDEDIILEANKDFIDKHFPGSKVKEE